MPSGKRSSFPSPLHRGLILGALNRAPAALTRKFIHTQVCGSAPVSVEERDDDLHHLCPRRADLAADRRKAVARISHQNQGAPDARLSQRPIEDDRLGSRPHVVELSLA